MKILTLLSLILISTVSNAELFGVVGSKNNVKSISMDKFQEYYSGKSTEWENGDIVILSMMDIKTVSGKEFFKKYVTVSESEFIDSWVNLEVFGNAVAPLNFTDVKKMNNFLKKYSKNGLGFIEKSKIKSIAKGLRVIPITK